MLWYFTVLISRLPRDKGPSQLSTRTHLCFFSFFLLLSNCTIYCISCFSKRIKLTSILLSRGVALTELTRTALSELKCYDEYLNWNWFYNLSSSLVSLRPEPSDINRYGYVGRSKKKRRLAFRIQLAFFTLCCFPWPNNLSVFLKTDEKVRDILSDTEN